MKKKISAAVCLLLAIFCTACSVKNVKELKDYARNSYGDAIEFVSSEKTDKMCTCYFRDKECGFTFSVTSSMTDVYVDGASFGQTEHTSSDYMEKYYDYIWEAIGQDAGDTILERDEISGFCMTVDADSEETRKAAAAAAKLLAEADVKSCVPNKIYIYNQNRTEIGAFDMETMCYMDAQDLENEYYMNCVRGDTGKEPEFLRHEVIPLKKIPGISSADAVAYVYDREPEEGVDVYYFMLDGAEQFITNYYVYAEDGREWEYYHSYEKTMKAAN